MMILRLFVLAALGSVLAAAAAPAQVAPAPALSPAGPAPGLCVYANKAYSEGASFCVAKLRAIVCLNGKWDTILPTDPANRIQSNPEVCSGPTMLAP